MRQTRKQNTNKKQGTSKRTNQKAQHKKTKSQQSTD